MNAEHVALPATHPGSADVPIAGTIVAQPRGKPRGATGPTTPAGKAIAARNATSHGIFAASLVQGVESAADWNTHHAGILESLAPETSLELELADRIALILWRLRRVTRYEAQTISSHVALNAGATALRRTRLLPPAKPLDRVMKYEAHLNRLLLNTLHDLEALQRRRQGDVTPLARLSISSDSPAALPLLSPQP